jgi:hypothetical protein
MTGSKWIFTVCLYNITICSGLLWITYEACIYAFQQFFKKLSFIHHCYEKFKVQVMNLKEAHTPYDD